MPIIESVFAVFEAIADWVVTVMPSIQALFYVSETGLTLLGTLSVASLGVGIFFLLLGVITNFFQFRA